MHRHVGNRIQQQASTTQPMTTLFTLTDGQTVSLPAPIAQPVYTVMTPAADGTVNMGMFEQEQPINQVTPSPADTPMESVVVKEKKRKQ